MLHEKGIQSVLDANRFAILATQDADQPHTSLMAITPMDGIRYLIVATYRDTLKHCNIMKNNRMAILVENRKESGYATHRTLFLLHMASRLSCKVAIAKRQRRCIC